MAPNVYRIAIWVALFNKIKFIGKKPEVKEMHVLSSYIFIAAQKHVFLIIL